MKKSILPLAVLAMIAASSSYAHDLWVNASAKAGEPITAEIGYGHDFPRAEEIPEARLGLFTPMQIYSEDGKHSDLSQKGENYQYVGDVPLEKGVYIVTATYKPTFWIQKNDGKWEQGKTRGDSDEVKYCEQAAMFGKRIVHIGDAQSDFAKKPIGQKLEIIPVDDPSNFREGEAFTVQVLYEGKPLKTTTVTGTFDGFPQDQKAFSGKTDLKGKIKVTPLHKGNWLLLVEHKAPFDDSNLCDETINIASLTVDVK